MSSQLEKKLQNFPSDYVTYQQLSILLPGSKDALYSQIKRALKENLLCRLHKSIYRRSKYLEKEKPHPFEMAHYLYWPSYVSLESALSFYGLIPEAIYTTTCVTTKRSTQIQNTFGIFGYTKLPVKNFFLGVNREVENNHVFFVASPWKAILDYIYLHQKEWNNLTALAEDLRLDMESLPPLDKQFAERLVLYYHHNRINRFLNSIAR